ncbi:phage BR0599 family protein [Sporomusa sp. KB1]|jgi:uncharacterized phage protein (TIGR02218 family)|uniref:phage BR0599 family protein n=1 Tax=Sporomusa sp. KB1 TaxID=943346 RepID=UPI0011A10A16|nr:phage BR0599 family protein [Sporomusa sp. KB1]TWH48562.1 putative phage protein (TIGR02218 family) [Sporomusa sp. KB1]
MAGTNIGTYEYSQQDGQPIECYKFTIGITRYQYTSSVDNIDLKFVENGMTRTETYLADYIKRQNVKPTCKGDSSALIVIVTKDNPVAKMYQGPPPEIPVLLKIYRLHEQDYNQRDIVFTGRVSQASFNGSDCELTVKVENWAAREIPNGKRQYTCNKVVYSKRCRLKEEEWQIPVFIDRVVGLNIFSTTFALYPDGHFAGGIFRFEGNVRLIAEHVGDRVRLKYPFIRTPRNEVIVAPGCDHLFSTCAKRFNNALNFDGCPWVPPTDPSKKEVGKGVYWVDSQVIKRDTDGYVGVID